MTKIPKIRLDDLLVERAMAESRKHAQTLILAGMVLVGDRPAGKAGNLVPADVEVRIRGEAGPYVSRGGLKLRGALDTFGLSVQGLTAIDVGSSTGGFTDCLLQAGAAKVYAIDVGYGQLAWKLRDDPRVVSIERTNIRHYHGDDITDRIDLAVIDTSFISLKLVIPPVLKLVKHGALFIALIKPQFEAKKGEVEIHGVVKSAALHQRVLSEIETFCRDDLGLVIMGSCESSLMGPSGNREFFICLKKPSETVPCGTGEREWS